MARYRTYKNGITGCRYKGCYILKGDKKGEFSILAGDGSPLKAGLHDFTDCQWEIDKVFAGREERARMEELYSKKSYSGELTSGEADLMRITETVRARKAKNRPF